MVLGTRPDLSMAVPSSVVGNHPGPTCLRTRGGGCAISKEPAADAPKLIATKPTVLQPQDSELIKLPSGGFACYASPLFKEYLGLLGDGVGAPAGIGEITPTDALLIIDMQRDFVPKSSTNTDGGRFGVAEGDHLIPLCEQLIHYVRRARRPAPISLPARLRVHDFSWHCGAHTTFIWSWRK